MRALTLLFVLVFASSAWAQSKEIKNPVPPITDEAKRASKSGDNSQGKQVVTVNPPLAPNTSVGGKLGEKSENKNDKRQEEGSSLAEWFIAFFTCGLVFVTAVLAYFTKELWASTGELVRDAKVTTKHELRAYMGVERIRLQEEGKSSNRPGIWKIKIRNFGKTMAKETEVWIASAIREDGLGDFHLGDRRSKTVVMPHEAMGFEDIVEMGESKINWFKPGPSSIYIWGKITYMDVFDKPHSTIFRFKSSGKVDLSDEIGLYEWKVKTDGEGANEAT
jgi:hypothetical protein